MILRPAGDAVEIAVRARPRARATGVDGPYGDRAIKISLAAPPVDGAANEELVDFLADLFGLPRRAVEIVRGHGSRDKVVRVRGVTEEVVRSRLDL